jgi:hypothetical protein
MQQSRETVIKRRFAAAELPIRQGFGAKAGPFAGVATIRAGSLK